MSTETTDNHCLSEAELREPSSSSQALVLRLREILSSCSKSVEAEDFSQSESSVSELVNFLDSVLDPTESDPENQDAKNKASDVLSEIYRHICSPSFEQAVLDALSFELPKAVARFACVSSRCLELVNGVIDRFIAACSPRDMFSILCEAMDSLTEMGKFSKCFAPLLSGLSKVFLSIRRRHFEQLKSAVPVIIKVLKAASSESYDGDTDLRDLYDRAVSIAESIHAVCMKLEGGANERLRALLGLYTLEIMALVSSNMREQVSAEVPFVLRLSHTITYCGLSYLGLITGSDVDRTTSIVIGEDEDTCMSCLADTKHGACLSVMWGHISNEVAQAARQDLTRVKSELQINQTKRWQAVGMLKLIFSSVNLPWELKKHAIGFLLCITDGNVLRNADESEFLCDMPSLIAALQAVQMVIIYTSDATLRKNAFVAMKRVLADIPTSQRFDILKALVGNSESTSMVAILIDVVRHEMSTEYSERMSLGNNKFMSVENTAHHARFFWSPSALELVEYVFRPPKGGPPDLPEQSDAILSALNLYRYVFITESTGNTNFTGVLSKDSLQKAYNQWLLPLRTLVTGIMAENREDHDQFASDAVCALNPVEMVLYRCIELVEEKLKHYE